MLNYEIVMFKIEDKKLIINEQTLTFPFQIGESIQIESMLLLLLKIPAGTIYDENVFGVHLE